MRDFLPCVLQNRFPRPATTNSNSGYMQTGQVTATFRIWASFARGSWDAERESQEEEGESNGRKKVLVAAWDRGCSVAQEPGLYA